MITSDGEREPLSSREVLMMLADHLADVGEAGADGQALDVIKQCIGVIEHKGRWHDVTDCLPCDECGTYETAQYDRFYGKTWCDGCRDTCTEIEEIEMREEEQYRADVKSLYWSTR